MRNATRIYDRLIGVRLSWIILFILVALCIYFGREYYHGRLEEHSTALYGGLVTSLIAVIIQMVMEWNEHREIENFKKMGILKVLPNREGKDEYYYKIIKAATRRIDFMGSTSRSFLRDFGSQDMGAGEKISALTRALARGVAVRILVVQKEHLEQKKHQKFDEAKVILDRLQAQYPKLFSYKYLSQEPSHTLVTADNECIVGTNIPEISADVTSAIHASTNSPYLNIAT